MQGTAVILSNIRFYNSCQLRLEFDRHQEVYSSKVSIVSHIIRSVLVAPLKAVHEGVKIVPVHAGNEIQSPLEYLDGIGENKYYWK